jgi:hypothetical protein
MACELSRPLGGILLRCFPGESARRDDRQPLNRADRIPSLLVDGIPR